MKGLLLVAALACALPAGILHSQAPSFAPNLIERGHYLAVAGDCAACHNSPTPQPVYMAGGYPIVSPLGTIYSTNITPSREHGIGNYSESQFANALRRGVRADGGHLYPAMPYTSFAGLSDDDVHALYAYFMRGVPPVERSPPKTRLPLPFNIRLSMLAWNTLFLKSAKTSVDPAHDAQWSRGQYLAQTLGHCSTCHSPRGLLMQERQRDALGGGRLGAWYAPNITSDKISGIGGWSRAEIEQYLATGRVPGKAQAAGDMADAITNSFSKLSRSDVAAIAAYIASVPAVRDAGVTTPSYMFGGPGHFESGLRGETKPQEGAHLYSGACASCHGADGSGSADGKIPSLFHNSAVGASRSDNLVAVILHGVDRTVGTEHVLMPAFGTRSFVRPMSDDEIAAVASFVRQKFGPGDAVSSTDVALARKGGKPSLLGPGIRGMMIAGTVLVLLLVIFWFRRRRRRGDAPIGA